MQQNAPFCILLKNNFLGGFVANPRPSTAFSLSRVGMYGNANNQWLGLNLKYKYIKTLTQQNLSRSDQDDHQCITKFCTVPYSKNM